MAKSHAQLFGEKPNGFALRLGQRGLCRPVFFVSFQITFQDRIGEASREKGLTTVYCFNGDCQIVSGVWLEHEPKRTGMEHVTRNLLCVSHGQNDDLLRGCVLHYLTGRFQPVHVRHIDVEQRDVGLKLRDFLDSLAPVSSLATNLPSPMERQERSYHAADDLVVVSKKNSKRGHIRSTERGWSYSFPRPAVSQVTPDSSSIVYQQRDEQSPTLR